MGYLSGAGIWSSDFHLEADSGRVARGLACNPIAFLGRTSYSIYLVHYLVLKVAIGILKYLGS
jgi:peptidoglycan/LPS O-acetylase OafA/YrhL